VDDEIFGFHAQQCVEKLFKALITAHGQEHSFTHNLTKLHNELSLLGERPPALSLSLDDLTEFAIEFRYESGKPFSAEQRDAMRASVAALKMFVEERCRLLKEAKVQVRVP
jgi:HEPN domain-containing protein